MSLAHSWETEALLVMTRFTPFPYPLEEKKIPKIPSHIPQLIREQLKYHHTSDPARSPSTDRQQRVSFFNIFSHPVFSKLHAWQIWSLPCKQLVGKKFLRAQSPAFIWLTTIQFSSSFPTYHTAWLWWLWSTFPQEEKQHKAYITCMTKVPQTR